MLAIVTKRSNENTLATIAELPACGVALISGYVVTEYAPEILTNISDRSMTSRKSKRRSGDPHWLQFCFWAFYCASHYRTDAQLS